MIIDTYWYLPPSFKDPGVTQPWRIRQRIRAVGPLEGLLVQGRDRSKVSLSILFWLRPWEGNWETQGNGRVGSKWVHPQRHMPLSLGKGNTGLLGRAGLWWGRGMETATCHLGETTEWPGEAETGRCGWTGNHPKPKRRVRKTEPEGRGGRKGRQKGVSAQRDNHRKWCLYKKEP